MMKKIMYEQIYSDLKEQIDNGKYKAGDRLPTERELSEKYGVSRITSKRAMDKLVEKDVIYRVAGKGSFVKEDIRKVKQLAEYTDSKKTHNKVIAVIFDDISLDFGAHLLKGIEKMCHKYGVGILFSCTYGVLSEEDKAIKRALDMGVSGIIILCAQGEIYNDTILRLARDRFPIVLLDRELPGIPIPCVKTDNYRAARVLTEILIRKGHKKLCFVTHSFTETSTISERYNGFMEAIMRRDDVTGVVSKLEFYDTNSRTLEDDKREISYDEVERVVKENIECSGFLAAEYKIGILIKRAFDMYKLDKEVVLFDGLPPIYDNGMDIVHIRQDETNIGKKAVETLIKIIDNEKVDRITNIPFKLYGNDI